MNIFQRGILRLLDWVIERLAEDEDDPAPILRACCFAGCANHPTEVIRVGWVLPNTERGYRTQAPLCNDHAAYLMAEPVVDARFVLVEKR